MSDEPIKRTPKKDRKKRETANGDLGFSEQMAAKRIGLSYMTLYRRRKAGEVKPHRFGSRIIYTDEILQELLEKNRVA